MQSVTSAASMALWGMSQAAGQVLQSTRSVSSGSLDHLPEDAVSLMSARTMFAANATVLKSLDAMEQDVLDILT